MLRLFTSGRKYQHQASTIPPEVLSYTLPCVLYSPKAGLYSDAASPSWRLCKSLGTSYVYTGVLHKFSLAKTKGLGFRRSSFASFEARTQMLTKDIAKQIRLALKNFYSLPTSLPVTGFVARKSLYTRAQDGYETSVNLATSYFQGTIQLFRALHLAFIFAPCIAMIPFAGSFGPLYRQFLAKLVHHTLIRAGPAFIKWGQWAAERPDLFPLYLCSQLSKLQTKAPAHSFAFTKETIEKAFDCKLSDIFVELEEKPVGSGSIAQVHRGTLRPEFRGHVMETRDGAVKVLHPGVADKMKRDIEIMKTSASLSKAIPALEWLRLDETVQQFAVVMMSQVDLSMEASNLNRFQHNFRKCKDVSFPKPIYPLVHPSVLVESFESGEFVSYYVDQLRGNERLKSSLADIGTHALLKMLLKDNFIHADMHPGNILVRMDHTKSKPHLVFLDVGMTAELNENDRLNLVGFFKSVARRDGQTAAECALRLSKKQNCPNPQAFIKDLKEMFDFWTTPEGDLVHPTDCFRQLIEKVRQYRVNIDGNVCSVMFTTLALGNWQRKLASDYDIMHTLQTMLLKKDEWAKSLSDIFLELMAP